MFCTGMTATITRSQLFAGAAVLALGPLAEGAAADPLPNGDLAYARLLVTAELLAADFYGQALAASNAGAVLRHYLARARFNEQEHYHSVAGILSGAGAAPATAADIDFTYPKNTFSSPASIVKMAVELENVMLGAYLGALGAIQTNAFRSGLGEIAASEAQHVSYFSHAAGGKAFNLSFPPALTIDQASNALEAFTS